MCHLSATEKTVAKTIIALHYLKYLEHIHSFILHPFIELAVRVYNNNIGGLGIININIYDGISILSLAALLNLLYFFFIFYLIARATTIRINLLHILVFVYTLSILNAAINNDIVATLILAAIPTIAVLFARTIRSILFTIPVLRFFFTSNLKIFLLLAFLSYITVFKSYYAINYFQHDAHLKKCMRMRIDKRYTELVYSETYHLLKPLLQKGKGRQDTGGRGRIDRGGA